MLSMVWPSLSTILVEPFDPSIFNKRTWVWIFLALRVLAELRAWEVLTDNTLKRAKYKNVLRAKYTSPLPLYPSIKNTRGFHEELSNMGILDEKCANCSIMNCLDGAFLTLTMGPYRQTEVLTRSAVLAKAVSGVPKFLFSYYKERRAKNSRYSLRAFARDLGISSGRLSAILEEKNVPSNATCQRLIKALMLNEKEAYTFLSLVQQAKKRRVERKADLILQDDDLDIIVDWVPYAILSLIRTPGFQMTASFIARRLGIETKRAKWAMDSLLEKGLLRYEHDRWERVQKRITTTHGIPSRAIRLSHINKMKLAIKKINQVDIDLCDYSSITFACDKESLTMAKRLIVDFRRSLAELCHTESATEVYNLNVQLFPLSQGK